MILHIDLDEAYTIEPGAHAQFTCYLQLNSANPHLTNINSDILIEGKILRHVASSSAEAEISGGFHNAQQAFPIRCMLI